VPSHRVGQALCFHVEKSVFFLGDPEREEFLLKFEWFVRNPPPRGGRDALLSSFQIKNPEDPPLRTTLKID